MRNFTRISLVLLALAAVTEVKAQTSQQIMPGYITNTGCAGGTVGPCWLPFSATVPLPTGNAGVPSAVTGTVSAATITNTSATVVAAATRRFLLIENESSAATIACSFGGTAALNTAGSFTILPNTSRKWSDYPVPSEALNCISGVASSPATVETY